MTKKLPKKVRRQVNFCLDALVSFLHADITERPALQSGNQGYSELNNTIYVPSQIPGNGFIYFREAARFLRSRLVPREEKFDRRVDEFFARIGMELGKDLAKNKPHFFEGNEPESYSDMKYFKKKYLGLLKHTHSETEEIKLLSEVKANTSKIRSLMDKDSNTLKNILDNYEKTHDLTQLTNALKSKKSIINARVLGKEVIKEYHKERSAFCKDIKSMTQYSSVETTEQSLETLDEHYQSAKNHLDNMRNSVERLKGILKRSDNSIKNIKIERAKKFRDFVIHFQGYLFAEKYMEQNPQWKKEAPSLFSQPDKVIIKNYFKKEVLEPYSGLCRKLEKNVGL